MLCFLVEFLQQTIIMSGSYTKIGKQGKPAKSKDKDKTGTSKKTGIATPSGARDSRDSRDYVTAPQSTSSSQHAALAGKEPKSGAKAKPSPGKFEPLDGESSESASDVLVPTVGAQCVSL